MFDDDIFTGNNDRYSFNTTKCIGKFKRIIGSKYRAAYSSDRLEFYRWSEIKCFKKVCYDAHNIETGF